MTHFLVRRIKLIKKTLIKIVIIGVRHYRILTLCRRALEFHYKLVMTASDLYTCE